MNHNIFWVQYNTLLNESAKKELMKNYMLGLKPSELDSFIFGNIAEIKQGVATAQLTDSDKSEISVEVNKIVDFLESSLKISKMAA